MSEVLATWNRDIEYSLGYILVLRVTMKLLNHFSSKSLLFHTMILFVVA